MPHKKRPLTSVVKGLLNMALQPGLEPGTHGLTVHCSTDWAIGEQIIKWCVYYWDLNNESSIFSKKFMVQNE